MVPKSYTLDLRLTADHFVVKPGLPPPATFSADAEATFEVLQDTSCLLLHAQVTSHCWFPDERTNNSVLLWRCDLHVNGA